MLRSIFAAFIFVIITLFGREAATLQTTLWCFAMAVISGIFALMHMDAINVPFANMLSFDHQSFTLKAQVISFMVLTICTFIQAGYATYNAYKRT